LANKRLSELDSAWREGDEDGVASAALGLVGLGPGLTPSGDDLLAGMMAVLKWVEPASESAARFGRAVSRRIVAQAPLLTTRLSARLLAYAAGGLLYEPAMRLGAALLEGRRADIEPSATRLFEIGHTSGFDMAAGIIVGANLGIDNEVWAEARRSHVAEGMPFTV
jgi:hypothetical protein